MTSVNRTSEFFALCQSFPPEKRGAVGALEITSSKGRYAGEAASLNSRPDPTKELRSFHKLASKVSQEIHSTSSLLSELTALIQKSSRSLFASDESDRLINSLVLRIKTNIESLNIQLDDAALIVAHNKRNKNSNKSHQAELEATNLVGQLKEEFVSTTKGFKEILQVRSDRIRERSEKKMHLLSDSADHLADAQSDSIVLMGNKPRIYDDSSSILGKEKFTMNSSSVISNDTKFSHGPLLDLTSPLLAMGGQINRPENETVTSGEITAQLPRPRGISGRGGGSTMYPKYSESSNSFSSPYPSSVLPVLSPLEIQRMEEQSGQSQMMQLIPDQSYMRQRADAMSQVEANIVQLGTIFNKLAVMVSEHQELVQRVEDNVEEANENIRLSLSTLTDTLTSMRTNKALIFKTMAVLFVFIVLFITFFA